MSQPPLIQLKDVSKFYGKHCALDNVSLEIHAQDFFSLLGGSGSGKTSLLRVLGGFVQPDSGHVLIDGIDVTKLPPYERPVNMMFQSYALFPHMTVKQNILFGLKQDKLSKTLMVQRLEEVLHLTNMEAYIDRKPHQLSGGQQQRVALARALAKHPKVLLLDEPLSALDKQLRERMQFELVDIQEKTGITFVMVTHDQAEAMTMSNRVAVMNSGFIEQVGAPTEIYEYPNNMFTARFMGHVNSFQCTLRQASEVETIFESEEVNCHFWLTRQVDVAAEQMVWCAVRPEKIIVSKFAPEGMRDMPSNNCIFGSVEDIAYLGGVSTYHVRLPGGGLIKAMDFNIERQADCPTWGDQVYLTWEPQNIMVLTS